MKYIDYIHISITYLVVTDDDGVCELLFSFMVQSKEWNIILPNKI